MTPHAPSPPSDGPPRARLTFRVGIVGHRPNRLPHDAQRLARLRQSLHAILSDVRDALLASVRHSDAALYSPEPPLLRAISPLAEGTDRIFAEEALGLGYELCCPMPFFQEEFEKDFAPENALEAESLVHFRALLAGARADHRLTVFEMNGERSHAPDAYGAAGRIVLNQTDLLVGVWDGGEPAGRGGTADTLHDAIRFHVPVIRIDAMAPENWQLLHAAADLSEAAPQSSPEARQSLADTVHQIVQTEVGLPAHASTDVASSAPDYFAEKKPKFNLAIFWKLFRDLVVDGRLSLPGILVGDFEAHIQQEWPVIDGTASVSDWVNTRLRSHFAWADGLADYYADAHRSAFVMSYLLSAAAVLVALLPLAAGDFGIFERICTGLELIILGRIIWSLLLARTRHWHERWTEYRLLAELIRELRFLIPLGGGKPLPRIPAHLAVYGDPAQTWMYWHVRAIARQIGIPDTRVTAGYVRECLDFLARVVGDRKSGQWGFHLQSERRARLLGKRLRRATFALFVLTFAGVAFRLLLQWTAIGKAPIWAGIDPWLTLAAAVLPALGAALEGISNQGEFTRVAKRSAAMTSGFEKYAAKIALLEEGPPPSLSEAIPLSSKISEAMVDEVVDWRAVFIDRPQ